MEGMGAQRWSKVSGLGKDVVAQMVKNLPAMLETQVQSLVGKIPWRRNGYPLQYSGLENSMDCIVYGVAKSRTRLSGFHFTSFHAIALYSRLC